MIKRAGDVIPHILSVDFKDLIQVLSLFFQINVLLVVQKQLKYNKVTKKIDTEDV